MKKIILISPIAPPLGGISTWSSIYLKYLKETDAEYDHINSSNQKKNITSRNFFSRFSGVISTFIFIIATLIFKVRNCKPQNTVIHLTTTLSLGVVRDIAVCFIGKLYNIKVVLHVHNGRTPKIFNSLRCKYVYKLYFKLFDEIIVIDPKSLAVLSENGISAKFIPNPISSDIVASNIQKDEHVWLYVGHIVHEKGVEELLCSYINSFNNKLYAPYLYLIGPYEDLYHTYLSDKFNLDKFDKIIFLGPLAHANVMSYLCKSSVLFLPSLSEGCPMVVLEAMICNTCVVATNVGAINYLLNADLDHQCGFCYYLDENYKLSVIMLQLYSDINLALRLGYNGGIRVHNEFVISKIAKKYSKCY